MCHRRLKYRKKIIAQHAQRTLCFEGASDAFCACSDNLKKYLVAQSADMLTVSEKYFAS